MNAVNKLELVKHWMRRVDASSVAERFRAYAMTLLDAPYVWGSENPSGCDCSGTVCFPLWCLGYDIRVTADALYRELFTKPPVHEDDLSRVMAVFYITRKDRQHMDRVAPAGTAVHVTPVVGTNVVLNAGSSVQLTTALAVRLYFEARDCYAVWREIDWEKAGQMSRSEKYAWEIDPVLRLIRA